MRNNYPSDKRLEPKRKFVSSFQHFGKLSRQEPLIYRPCFLRYFISSKNSLSMANAYR
jgi:hypothetical protein